MANVTKPSMLVKVAKGSLWVASWLVALWWLALRFFYPTTEGKHFRKVTVGNRVGRSPFFGRNATNYILFSCPVIALAIFALLYLELEKYPTERNCRPRKQWRVESLYRAMWTHPLVVRSPLGILTLVEILGIALALFCVSWVWGKSLSNAFDEIPAGHHLQPGLEKWQMRLKMASSELGGAIPFTVALLFLPVTRGSPILRLIDVPFEQAVRYHRWIGNLTVLLVTVHGVTYAIYAGSTHELSLLAEWKPTGIANLAGVVSAIAGMIMWATSLSVVRRRFFDFFYGVHHLYLLFFAFYVFHVGWNHVGNELGTIFLFFIDRFLRIVQSRREVSGASARVLPNGHVALKIPKHSGFRATPLSFLYINIPRVSNLEWHPFSITSSPFEDAVTMTIKPLGDWTLKLQTIAMAGTQETLPAPTGKSFCPFAVKLRTEGPYGHESNYYLRYDNLVLIAGGVGVTPFLAILRDLLIRYDLQQPHLPSNVQLIWCVKRSAELAALHDICPAQIYPGYVFEDPTRLTLNVHAYVTDEEHSDCLKPPRDQNSQNRVLAGDAIANRLRGFSGTSNLWLVAIILSSVAGFAASSGLLHEFVVAARPKENSRPFSGAVETTLFFVSLFVGIVACGGAMILLWITTGQIDTRNAHPRAPEECGVAHHLSILEMHEETLLERCSVTKHSRPDFQDILSGVAAEHAGEEIGVMVSGNQGLHESVAIACRSLNFHSRSQFHLHSVSFDL